MSKSILVIGAGASGMAAAIAAAREGASVTLLEQNDRPGRKLAATGNGRCNFTNMNMSPAFFRGEHPDFVKPALNDFQAADAVRFFSSLGIYSISRNGYMYPACGQAQSVVDVLVMELRHLGVKLKTNEQILRIEAPSGDKDSGFSVHTNSYTYSADAVILACGSAASSIAGSGTGGYELARQTGHRVITPLPALTALKCSGECRLSWAGVRVDGKLTLAVTDLSGNKTVYTERGELQLTDYGISGIPVFNLSRFAVRALEEKQKAAAVLDFLPDFSDDDTFSFLQERRKNCPYKSSKEFLIGLFPEKLIPVLLTYTDKMAGKDAPAEEYLKALSESIKRFPLTVQGGLSFTHAQVCQGGVDTCAVNPDTMESRKLPGLFFCGELLDVDGPCGGYNLQWAWASGMMAGRQAARQLSRLPASQDC